MAKAADVGAVTDKLAALQLHTGAPESGSADAATELQAFTERNYWKTSAFDFDMDDLR